MKTRRVLKYKLSNDPFPEDIPLPYNTDILTVINQYEQLTVYADVPDEEPAMLMCNFRFHKVMMGATIPDNPGRYIGTVALNAGQYIIHVYLSRPQGSVFTTPEAKEERKSPWSGIGEWKRD